MAPGNDAAPDKDADDAIERAIARHGEALAALERGELDRAHGCAVEALELFERDSGQVHPDVANVLNCLARIEEGRARYAEADACTRRSVAIMRDVRLRASGAEIDRLYLQSLAAHGDTQRILGQYAAAEALLREALAIAEQAFDPHDEDTVRTLNSLGVLFKYSGRFDEARALYERAIELAGRSEADAGADAALATLLHNLGGLEHARGDYARGEPPARRAVELRERALGPDHPVVAADLAALAALVDAQGRHKEAEAMYEKALTIFERAYGPDHYEIAVTLNNLAGIRQAQGRYVVAERHYRRALAIKEALLGPAHPDVAMTQNNLALLLAVAGRTKEAEMLYASALETFASALDRDHPKVQACLDNYAGLLRDLGRDEAARALVAKYGS